MKFGVLLLLTGLLLTWRASGQGYQPSVDMDISNSPMTVLINGRPTIFYELHLTSFARDTLELKSLYVLDRADSNVYLSLSPENICNRFHRIGSDRRASKAYLPPGASGWVYLEITLPEDGQPQLVHELSMEILQRAEKKNITVRGGVVTISSRPAVVLGAPLKGGPWAAVYSPVWDRGHRRVIYTVGGKARIPGRFAIDFIKLNEQGKYASGDENETVNWFGYNEEVLAVTDGTVVAVKNDFPEESLLSEHPLYSADKAGGNYITLDMGNGYFVFYEHLKPGSVLVKEGEKVRKGDVIAAVGFTGQTTGPHLHLHVADANSALGAEGIPFSMEIFTLLGAYPDFQTFGKEPWKAITTPVKIIDERPAPNTVIQFK